MTLIRCTSKCTRMSKLVLLGFTLFMLLVTEATAQDHSVVLEDGNSMINLSASDTLEGNAIITLLRDGPEGRAGTIYNFREVSDSNRVEVVYGHGSRWFVGTQDSVHFGIFYESKKYDIGNYFRSLSAIRIDADNNDDGRYGDFTVDITGGRLGLNILDLESVNSSETKALRLHGGDFIPESFITSYDLGNAEVNEHWDNVVAREFVDFTDLILTKSRSLKSNGYGLNQVMQLHPIKATNRKSKTSKIALDPYDVVKYIPEAVHTYDDDIGDNGKIRKKKVSNYGMKYNQLIPVLIQAIQDQQEIINQLQLEVESIKEKVE